MLACLNVEHEIYQRTFEARTSAVQNCEPCGCDLRRAFEIEDAECCSEIDMVLRLEIKLRWCAPATNFSIRRFIFTNGHACVRSVGQRREQIVHARLGCGSQLIQFGDAILQ